MGNRCFTISSLIAVRIPISSAWRSRGSVNTLMPVASLFAVAMVVTAIGSSLLCGTISEGQSGLRCGIIAAQLFRFTLRSRHRRTRHIGQNRVSTLSDGATHRAALQQLRPDNSGEAKSQSPFANEARIAWA